MIRAFEDELKIRLIIPEHPEMMGATGAALLAMRRKSNEATRFKGLTL